MTNTNPPQERATTNCETDPKRNARCLAELLRVAKCEFAAQERREALAREFGPLLQGDFEDAGAELTCCVRGFTTREIPCRNREWWGCPFNERGRERSRGGYER
jgi:hypothetical protein